MCYVMHVPLALQFSATFLLFAYLFFDDQSNNYHSINRDNV